MIFFFFIFYILILYSFLFFFQINTSDTTKIKIKLLQEDLKKLKHFYLEGTIKNYRNIAWKLGINLLNINYHIFQNLKGWLKLGNKHNVYFNRELLFLNIHKISGTI